MIALTIGDPNGIGPEIAVKAALACVRAGEDAPAIVGDTHVVRHYVERFGDGLQLRALDATGTAGPRDLPFVPIDAFAREAFTPGVVSAAAGAATVAYVRAAVDLVRVGRVAAIVAAPHNETAVNAAGIAFSGYPRLLADLMDVPADRVFLLLAGGGLRIVHATLHERLADALARLSVDLVVAAAEAAVRALQTMGIAQPRVGIFGINPHASEGGLFGDDDARVTLPAAERLRAAGVIVDGPAGADVLLAARACDVYVAMVHDQGHIPVKLLAPRDAAALSIGGGVVFSSVAHGSAFDIAGSGRADPSALIRALRLVATNAAPRSVHPSPATKEFDS